ncbi:MAG: cytochrome c peroxidase [Pseudomonadota bacterium]
MVLLLASPLDAATMQATDFPAPNPELERLGQLLFYDKILSGNRNISCGTCHHHRLHGTDGLSLGIGEGGHGVGLQRKGGVGRDKIRKRVPRNAPALWNLGHKDVRVMFHDGRLTPSELYSNGFNSPAEEWLPQGLDTILAAQALFPMTAQFEMAGNLGENEVTHATQIRIDRAWPILAKRVANLPGYLHGFKAIYPEIKSAEDLSIVHIGNAIGAFIASEWQSFDSPYDALVTQGTPLLAPAERGRQLFFGEAGCSGCHNGPLFTNQSFYALGLPSFGPGRTRRFDPMPRDVGRMGESDALSDAYRFRVPSLRNVALTAPYGHNGAYPTLEAMVRHHLAPTEARKSWHPSDANLPEIPWLQEIDFVIQSDVREMARQAAKLDIDLPSRTDSEILDIVAFLESLTGTSALSRPLGIPTEVPSELPVDH